MNIYVSARDPPLSIQRTEGEAQTEQEKGLVDLEEESIQRMRDQVRDSVNQEILQRRIDEIKSYKERKKKL